MTREVQNLLLGRLYRMQGLTNRGVVNSVFGRGTVSAQGTALSEAMSALLRARLGVATEVAHFPPGGTVELIRLESRHKAICLVKREIEGAGA